MFVKKLLFLLALTAVAAFADTFTITATDPNFGTVADHIFGDPLHYAIQDVTLQGPTNMVGPWTLTVDTNYAVPLPGSPEVIPGFVDGVNLFMGDFLVQQGSNFFGVVLHAHDGYTAGDLYQAAGFQNSVFYNPGKPVSLDGGGTLIGQGTVSAAANPGCNGVNCAEFKVTDVFNLNALGTFIDPNSPLTFSMASATCANGLLNGDDAPVPEPGSVALLGTVGILFGFVLWRRKTAA
ncbi:MAG TPA: PEP-CTERM sorting domain-containing protein [Bryobacteraceae bacterium]|nr:PEP-CTERM sorting domain-containing protein [Bryobacteraceae bacterium]